MPSSAIAWETLPVKVVNEVTCWPEKPAAERFAGINSFGFSGTNAHVILRGYSDGEEISDLVDAMDSIAGAPHRIEINGSARTSPSRETSVTLMRPKHILPISGKSLPSLKDAARTYIDWVSKNVDTPQVAANQTETKRLDFSW